MLRGWFLAIALLGWAGAACAASVADATGRSVEVPDHVGRVLPAGPPAAVILAALAPDLMLGWTGPLPDSARALLGPVAAHLPQVPRLTGRDDVTAKIVALKPDLIFDYGTVAPRYVDLAKATQERTGIPTVLLDGALAEVPHTFRLLGSILHREDRAEVLARFAEALLAIPPTNGVHPRVLYARGGADGLTAAVPGTDLADTFTQLGWQVVVPPGEGPSRQVSIDDIRSLDPDVVLLADPTIPATLSQSDAWQSLRAVRDGHALIAPRLPFGWLDEPPSINRLLGLAWLGGGDPRTLASLFNAAIYGRPLTAAELDSIVGSAHSIQP